METGSQVVFPSNADVRALIQVCICGMCLIVASAVPELEFSVQFEKFVIVMLVGIACLAGFITGLIVYTERTAGPVVCLILHCVEFIIFFVLFDSLFTSFAR